jgi:NADPH-ferrihemoprotein reductase
MVPVTRAVSLISSADVAAKGDTDIADVYLLVLDIANTAIAYQAGDHCGIFPVNPHAVVEEYLSFFGISRERWADTVELLSPTHHIQSRATMKNMFPAAVSLFDCLSRYIDLCGPVKKATLRELAKHCFIEEEKQTFLAILNSKDQAHGQERSFASLKEQHRCRTVLDFLKLFPSSSSIPLNAFLEIMPRLQPRYYSIASDQQTHKTSIELLIKITPGGLFSEYLASEIAERRPQVPIFVRKSAFHLPTRNKQRPVVMIGPGTGIAPFIGFAHRRSGWIARKQPVGEAVLYTGCRYYDADFFFERDLSAFSSRSGPLDTGAPLTEVHVAFSRSPAVLSWCQEAALVSGKPAVEVLPGRRIYVQDLMRREPRDACLFEMIVHRGANIYICGDAGRMAKDVENAIIEILVKKGRMSLAAAEKYVQGLEAQERLLKDVW